MDAYGIPVADWRVVANVSDAEKAEFEAVMKNASDDEKKIKADPEKYLKKLKRDKKIETK